MWTQLPLYLKERFVYSPLKATLNCQSLTIHKYNTGFSFGSAAPFTPCLLFWYFFFVTRINETSTSTLKLVTHSPPLELNWNKRVGTGSTFNSGSGISTISEQQLMLYNWWHICVLHFFHLSWNGRSRRISHKLTLCRLQQKAHKYNKLKLYYNCWNEHVLWAIVNKTWCMPTFYPSFLSAIITQMPRLFTMELCAYCHHSHNEPID